MKSSILKVSLFHGVSVIPLYVAQSLGLMRDAGIELEITRTANSDSLIGGLLDGTFQVVHANPDNFIAWADRTDRPILAWAGGSIGPLRLVGRSGIDGLEELEGGTIAVDSPLSGWIPITKIVLASVGLTPDMYSLDAVGGTRSVFEAVRESRADACMLSMPWWLRALDSDLPVLADHRQHVDFFQGSAAASMMPWLEANRSLARDYKASLAAATDWMYRDANREALEKLVGAELQIPTAHARVICREMLEVSHGWPLDAEVDRRAFEFSFKLRESLDGIHDRDPERYIWRG